MVIGFNEKCYELLKRVPKGKVVTYKDIAKMLGSKAYRAVGNAMHRNPNPWISGPQTLGKKSRSSLSNKNPYAPKVLCHRVVKSDGSIGGYAKGIKKKIELLRKEGVSIRNNKINLEKYRYKFT